MTRIYFLLALLVIVLALAIFAEPGLLALRVLFSQGKDALPLPRRPPAQTLAEAQAQDCADLRLLPGLDRSFSPASRAAFFQSVDALMEEAGRMSPARFWMEVSRLVALAGNAHTGVNVAQRAQSFGRVPLRFAWFADGLYIVRATQDHADLLGRRVVEIDGRPAAQALAEIQPYFSGIETRAKALSPPMLETPALLQAIWPETDGAHLAIRTQSSAGDIRDDTLAALPPMPDRFSGQPIAVIGALPESGDLNWLTVLSRAPDIPLSLRQQDHVAFSAPLDDGGLYVRINANGNDARGRLADQLAAIAASRPPGGWRWIALDVRFNDGGDELKTMAFTRALPQLLSPDGNLYVLVGNATFSAAIIIAARARVFVGKARTHIVGEPVGDHARFWTDGGAPLVLRNSGIEIAHAYFLHDWSNGCRSPRDCHPYQWLYGVAAGDLTPDVAVGWNFADYAAGRDTVLDRVRQLERARR
jgi:hypothetical protein